MYQVFRGQAARSRGDQQWGGREGGGFCSGEQGAKVLLLLGSTVGSRVLWDHSLMMNLKRKSGNLKNGKR